jgi:hypothetical protein
MNIEERVKHYIGNIKTQKWEIQFDTDTFTCYYKNELGVNKTYTDICPLHYGVFLINNFFTPNIYSDIMSKNCKILLSRLMPGETFHTDPANFDGYVNYNITGYIDPIIKLIKSDTYFENKNLLIRPGDVYYNFDCPIISKTRPVGDSYNVIINLDGGRHWNDLKKIPNIDIPFRYKNNKIVWRGSATGFLHSTTRPTRLKLVETYWNNPNKMIDIAFIWYGPDKNLSKCAISMEEQLKSKFLISVEGGDVATGLKWMLYSNSTVLMPTPTMISWAMEDRLEPWVHYVPLNKDFDDLEEKYEWCLNNLNKCEEIANNGKKFIEQFLDEEKEAQITNLVLKEYFDNVIVTKTVNNENE